MIRIIYRWKLLEANETAFRDAWEKATTTIRETTKGARGSVFLKSCQTPEACLTIARWDSYDDWQAFWNEASPPEMKVMHQLAELVSTEAFDEMGDHTI